MDYIKAMANVIIFEDEDVVTESQTCGQTQYDAEHCDGVSQAVTKPF